MKQFLVIFSISMLAMSCKKDKASAFSCTDEISFSQQVEPLINMNCSTSGCHDVTAEGGYEFKDHATISAAADRIIAAIEHQSGTVPMPLGDDKLPDSLIRLVVCWSSAGKLDN